jgi:hypothetical protein
VMATPLGAAMPLPLEYVRTTRKNPQKTKCPYAARNLRSEIAGAKLGDSRERLSLQKGAQLSTGVELVAKGASKHPPRLTSNPSITPRVRGYHQDYRTCPEPRDHYRRANSNNCYASYHAKELRREFSRRLAHHPPSCFNWSVSEVSTDAGEDHTNYASYACHC